MMRVFGGATLVLLVLMAPSAPTLALAQTPPPPPPSAECRDLLPVVPTTIELRGADVPTTLRLLAERFQVSLLVTPDVTGVVTMSLYAIPVREVFDTVVRTAGLTCIVRDKILIISTGERVREQERKEQEARARADFTRLQAEADTRKRQVEARREEAQFAELQARGPLREEMIRLTYADADDVAKTLMGILGIRPGVVTPAPALYLPPPPVEIPPEGRSPVPTQIVPPPGGLTPPDVVARGITVSAHLPTNSVFIRHYEADLARIRLLIKEQLDLPLPQVLITAQMVIVTRNALEQLGVSWGGAVAGNAGRSTLVGQGLSQPLNPATGVGTPPVTGTPTLNTLGTNPPFSPQLPIDPVSGLASGGNVVNLPLAGLPTLTAGAPAFGALFGIVASHFNLNLAIQALEVQGKARTLAEPKTVTLSNARAVISRGFEVPFTSASQFGTQVQFKEALLKLDVIPRVIREPTFNRIRMKVVVENNEPDFTQPVGGNPPIFKRRSENEVIIREGERLVIGGIIIDSDTKTVRQVPVLGNVPFLGWLFKSRELNVTGEEMIVIITPSVLPVGTAQP
jgi:type IV pilus assembly protein PilQ